MRCAIIGGVHPDDRDALVASFEREVATQERWRAEFRLARADESYGTVVVRGIVVRDPSGVAVRVIGAIIDVTERIQLQQQLEQARRMESLGRVATTVAHEFNKVLMGMAALPDIMRRAPNPHAVEQAAMRISEAVARGRRLTEEILRFGKPAEPAVAVVDLTRWLERLLTELRILAGRNLLTLNIRKSPVCVAIDADQMQQLLTNLVVNARDAMPVGGTIRLTVETDRTHAILTVADDGTGIAPDVLAQIFEPLFTTKRSGTGLGLAVAQQIIVQHRGTIEVTSTFGEGTNFRILLPLAE